MTPRSRSTSPSSSGAILAGAVVEIQKSATASNGVAPPKSRPATPRIVTGWPLTRTVLPIKSGRPPKRVIQRRWLITAAVQPGRASSVPKSRPAAGETPSTWK